MAESYLELSQGETAAGTDTAVVLDGRASHNGSELVDGSGSKGSGLGLAGSASPRLLAGLYHTSQNFNLMMEFFRDGMFLSRRGIAIPGRSGFEPGAANPCGSLYEGSVAGVLAIVGFHRRVVVLTVLEKLLVVLDRLWEIKSANAFDGDD